MNSDETISHIPALDPTPGSSTEMGPASKKACVANAQSGSSAIENKAQISKRTIRKRKKCMRVHKPLSSINQLDQLQMEVQPQLFSDDDDGHLSFNVGDILEQYSLLGFLGKGSFGRVAKARHNATRQVVALKIARSTPSCVESAKDEISMLRKIRQIDPLGKNLWIEMLDTFEVQNHVCIAFEKLGDSLYTFLSDNKFQPFQLSQIRHFAYQICHSVKALHDNSIVHTDLKPENICLASSDFTFGVRPTRQQTYRKPLSTNIRLIDFGSSTFLYEDLEACVQTRHYRAPEVLFQCPWNQAVDVWSIGCILFELYTGECLFPAQDDDEHYQVMEEVLGPIPDLYCCTALARRHTKEAYPPRKKSVRSKPLKKYMQMSVKEHQEFFDLIEKMLNFDPEKRVTLAAASNHPFFALLSDAQRKFQA